MKIVAVWWKYGIRHSGLVVYGPPCNALGLTEVIESFGDTHTRWVLEPGSYTELIPAE